MNVSIEAFKDVMPPVQELLNHTISQIEILKRGVLSVVITKSWHFAMSLQTHSAVHDEASVSHSGLHASNTQLSH